MSVVSPLSPVCAPAGALHNVKETAPWRCIRFIAITPTTSELAVGAITTKRPQLSARPFLSHLAERTRFELAVELPLRQFSKLLVSATHPPLQCFGAEFPPLLMGGRSFTKRLQSYKKVFISQHIRPKFFRLNGKSL